MLGLMSAASLRIGQVAERTGLSVDAIRFYEKSGLLPRPHERKAATGSIRRERLRISNLFRKRSCSGSRLMKSENCFRSNVTRTGFVSTSGI